MLTKEEKIEKYLSEPVKIGDIVHIKGLSSKNKESWSGNVTVEKIEGDDVFYKSYGYKGLIKLSKGNWKKSIHNIGINPFPKKAWNDSLRIVKYQLSSILYGIGWERRKDKGLFKTEKFGEIEVPELEWNPFIIDEKGNEICYQRAFVWSTHDKQLLIESIYNNIDIGKIVIRKRSYEWVENRVKQCKKAAFKDIVDGKQRLNAILGFVNNEFSDLKGNYWKDLSNFAQNRFLDFGAVSYGELGENTKDKDVLQVFLGINFTGVPQSKEHIDFVKELLKNSK